MINLETREAFDLTAKFGSPLYIFDEKRFLNNYMHLTNAYRGIYPKFNIAYSYKTNYTPYICQKVKELGGYAEVVSSMEYWLAKQIGYENDKIIFNGPVKGEALYEQLSRGGSVNIDNLEELYNIISFAKESSQKEIEVVIRVNIDIGQSFISRFGIDSDNGDLDLAFKELNAVPNISVIGLHCHVGRSRGIQAWKNRVEIMLELVDKHFKTPPRFIDLGSGMNSVMEPSLASQFGDDIPTYEEYAEVVASEFYKKYGNLPKEQQPELIVEPGTTVVSGYMYFLSKVLSIKTVKNKCIATLDGSYGNISEICLSKQLPIKVFSLNSQQELVKDANFVGYTCLEHDVLYRNYTGNLSVGDLILFDNIGSYSNVFKPPFISPNCAMIAISENREIKLIKRRETFEDIFQTYVF